MRLTEMLIASLKVCLCFSLIFPFSAFAHIISITPTPGLAVATTTSSVITGAYTVTNLTTRVPLTIIDKSQFPPGLSILFSTCGVPIGPGQSCVITLQLLAPNAPTVINALLREWASPSIDGVQIPITVAVIPTPPPPPPVLTTFSIATGQDLTGTQPGLLVQSFDGINWSRKGIINLPATDEFVSSSCTGLAGFVICVAVGNDPGFTTPVIASTINNGTTWATRTITGAPASSSLLSVSCNGSDGTAICIAAGTDNAGPSPLIVGSSDGGVTWTVRTITGGPATGQLFSVSCTASGLCTAVGTSVGDGFVLVSTDGGNNFTPRVVTGLPATSSLDLVSCSGSGATAICAASGLDGATNFPILVTSQDGGATWALVPVAGTSIVAQYKGIDCTGNAGTGVCVAAGITTNGNTPPILVASTDGGASWVVKNVIGGPPNGAYAGTSCTGDPGAVSCIVVGGVGPNGSSASPIIVASTDNANTFSVTPVAGTPTFAVFEGASCTGSGASIYCVASGSSDVPAPLVATSLGSVTNFVVRPIANAPATGFLNTASTP